MVNEEVSNVAESSSFYPLRFVAAFALVSDDGKIFTTTLLLVTQSRLSPSNPERLSNFSSNFAIFP